MTSSSTPTTGSKVEFRVLGQLEALTDRVSVGLGGRKQRLVLAVLLANVNEVITQDSLIEAIWNGSSTDGGPRSLHTYVSLLRKILGGEIERVGGGYRLVANASTLDAIRFDELVRDARVALHDDPGSTAERLRDGLGLWRGEPYGDLGGEPALVAEANRLSEARLEAFEMRFEADLALGRHREIIPEVEAILANQPYREHLAAIQMLALYRSERQAEALRIYRDMRTRLVEELGVEPGAELQVLEQRILDHDTSLGSGGIAEGVPTRATARSYELHDIVDTTTFGPRYRGFEKTTGREVLLLAIGEPSRSSAFIRRFEPEMDSISRLEHPHLLPIYDHWRDPDSAYVVTPSPRGGPLATAMVGGALSLTSALRINDQLAMALGFLRRHERRHGAVSAQSVLLDEERNAYLTDSGICGIVGREPDHEDTYQLAELLCTMIGAHPGEAPWPAEIPSDLEHALARALHTESDHRFASAEDFARAVRQSAGLDVMPVAGLDDDRFERRNPFKGLRAFQESDAADFHGRDSLVNELLDALVDARLVSVVGPSGSGKSSVVRAGLFPRLRRGDAPSAVPLLITDMYPGTHPFESLETALSRVATTWGPDVASNLRSDPSGLREVAAAVSPPYVELVLLIDQFEETFSLVNDPAERDLFLRNITDAVSHETSSVRIILTLRADFFDQPLASSDFAEAFRESVVAVGPPTHDGLTRAVTEPATRAGVAIEPGLTTQIVADVMDQPGGLPLLQFTLSELFATRNSGMLTAEAYAATGGVAGALGTKAEQTYGGLSPPGRNTARQLFLRLVTVDDQADDTRRRVPQSELLELDIDASTMVDVIQQFGALRFLTFDRDPATRTPTIELAHEAILREWPRLQSWIDERRADLLIHRRVQVAVQDWRESEYNPAYLLRGGQLDQARAWLERTDMAVAEDERRLIDESSQTEEQERREREELEKRAARRRRAVVTVLAIAAVVATILGAYAFTQRQEANQNAAHADARGLALSSLRIANDDPELGILLAAEAIQRSASNGGALPEAMGALWSAYVENRTVLRLDGVGARAVTYSPDGSTFAVDSPVDGMVTIRDSQTGDELVSLTSSDQDALGYTWKLSFSPDGGLLAVARQGASSEAGTLEVFDARTGEIVHRFGGGADGYSGVSFSDTGHVAGLANHDGFERFEIITWDVATGERVSTVPTYRNDYPWPTPSIEFLAGGTELLVGMSEPEAGIGALMSVDVVAGTITRVTPIDFAPSEFALGPSEDRVALVSEDMGLVAVYDLSSAEPVFEPVPHQLPQAVSFSHDGAHFAVSGNESDVTIIDADSGDPQLVLSGHTASVWSTSFHPSAERIASVSFSGETRVWDVSSEGPADGGLVAGERDVLSLDTTAKFVVPSLTLEGAVVFDRETGEVVGDHDMLVVVPTHPAVARHADRLAGVSPDGSSAVVELSGGDVVYELPPCSSPVAISPDAQVVALDWGRVPRCDATPSLSGILDLETGRVYVDYGRRHSRYGSITGLETFDGRRYAAIVVEENEVSQIEIWALDAEPSLLGTFSEDHSDSLFYLLVSFSDDGRYLAAGTNGERALVIDVEALSNGASESDSIVFNQRVHTSNAPLALITPGGVVATAGFDGFHRHWDLATGELLFELEVDGVRGHTVNAYSPDYAHYFYEDHDGIIRRMPTDIDEMVEVAMASVTRDFTPDECGRYLKVEECSAFD